MNWSIDAEWYDPITHLLDESILIYWLKEDWTEHRRPTCSVGHRFDRNWFVGWQIISQNHVVAWTWLPKMPMAWRAEHEEND